MIDARASNHGVPLTHDRWRVLSPLLDAALDLAADRRAAFVASVCPEDSTLREQLERMLSACDRDGSLVEGFAAERFASLITAAVVGFDASADPNLELQAVRAALRGRYHVERKVGAGGMATVYLAYETPGDRRVAIKVLRPGLTTSLPTERFLREIRVTAALRHPRILPLYDSGQADGIVYFVMPFIDGESLRARLQRMTRLPLDEALRVTRSVAEALDYAHRHGFIHRDIKPENILLANDTGGDPGGVQTFVADFGVAVAAESADEGRLTQSGVSIGTPAYMSPEQAAAKRNVTPASDVYALAAVLYEMLVGEPPIGGPSGLPIIARVISEAPVPLGKRPTSVPPHIDAAVMKALAKSPADRFAGVAEFVAALDGFGAATASTTRAHLA